MNLSELFTPEAGQARTAWLNRQDTRAADALDYYLGPTGIPDRVRALGELAWLFSPAGDVREMYDQSGNLMRARTPVEAATAATALTAAAGSMFIPGNARAIAEGLDGAGDAARRFAGDDAGAVPVPAWAGDRAGVFDRIEHTPTEHGSAFSLGDAVTEGFWDGPNFHADVSFVPSELRRQGISQALHDAALAEAQRRGGTLFSGYELSPDGRALYEGLGRKGYGVDLVDLLSGESAYRVTPPAPK